MTGQSMTDQLEREAAKYKPTDLLHQSDQSLHYQEIYKAQHEKTKKVFRIPKNMKDKA
jgi:hypothetical protein